MPLILLKYREPTTVDGAVIVGATWNLVPINGIVRDDNGNCKINLNNSFTISNRVYPKICKFNMNVTALNNTGAAMLLKSRLLLVKGATTQILDTSLNSKLITNQSQTTIKQRSSISLNISSTFRFELFSSNNGLFGRAINDGTEERYASVEITIE